MSHSMTQEATNTKRRWGCACGCLVLVGGGFLAALIFGVLAARPTPTVQREQIIAAQTSLYGEMKLTTKDAGLSEMVRAFIMAKAPEAISFWRDGATEIVVNPQSAVLVDEDGPGDWKAYVMLQPANAASRYVARTILDNYAKKTSKAQVRTVDGAKVVSLEGGRALAMGSRMLVFGADTPRLADLANAGGVDNRRSSETRNAMSEEMAASVKLMDSERPGATDDAVVMLANKPGRMPSLLQWLERECKIPGLASDLSKGLTNAGATPDSFAWLRLTVDIQSADRVVFELSMPCATPEQATAVGEVLKPWVPRCIPADLKLTQNSEASTHGTRAVVRTTVDGFNKLITAK